MPVPPCEESRQLMRIAINNGTIIDPANGIESPGTLVLEDGRVSAVLNLEESTDADEIIDATGLLVCPGFVDLHVSLREPGFEEDETIATGHDVIGSSRYPSQAKSCRCEPLVHHPCFR